MTPNEKAQNIIAEINIIVKDISISVKCAEIVANEMIRQHNFSGPPDPIYTYWVEVKKEINK